MNENEFCRKSFIDCHVIADICPKWHARGNSRKAFKRTNSIHLGWIKCDGSVVPHHSIWSGFYTANLNGEGRFLRGGNPEQVLIRQESGFQNHDHQIRHCLHLNFAVENSSHSIIRWRWYEMQPKKYWFYLILNAKDT